MNLADQEATWKFQEASTELSRSLEDCYWEIVTYASNENGYIQWSHSMVTFNELHKPDSHRVRGDNLIHDLLIRMMILAIRVIAVGP